MGTSEERERKRDGVLQGDQNGLFSRKNTSLLRCLFLQRFVLMICPACGYDLSSDGRGNILGPLGIARGRTV